MADLIHPVYIDGPLKGKDFPIEGNAREVYVEYPISPRGGVEDLGKEPESVRYALRRFGFSSGGSAVLLWFAYCEKQEPEVIVIADLILSDYAKQAIIKLFWRQLGKRNERESWRFQRMPRVLASRIVSVLRVRAR